jgi:hypothetical protein
VLDLRDELDTKSRALGLEYPDALEAAYEAANAAQPEAPAGLGTVAISVQAQVEAANVLLDAIAAEARPDGLLGWIGLLGTDLSEDLDRARGAFTAGELDTVRELSAGVEGAVDDASENGNVRVLVALGAVILIVGVAATVVRRRRASERRRAEAVMVPSPSPGPLWGQAAASSSSSSTGRVDGVAEPPAGSPTSDDGTP